MSLVKQRKPPTIKKNNKKNLTLHEIKLISLKINDNFILPQNSYFLFSMNNKSLNVNKKKKNDCIFSLLKKRKNQLVIKLEKSFVLFALKQPFPS